MSTDHAAPDREVLAEVLADYADARVPYVTDNPDVAVPFALTPAADADLDTWTGPAPDPRELAVARDAWARPAIDPEPEPEWDAEAHPGWDIPGAPEVTPAGTEAERQAEFDAEWSSRVGRRRLQHLSRPR